MKLRFLTLLILLSLSMHIQGQFIIQKTASIDSLTLQKIREACNPDSFPNSSYAEPLIARAFNRNFDDGSSYDLVDGIERYESPVDIQIISEKAYHGAFPNVHDVYGVQLIDITDANDSIQSLNVQALINFCSDDTIDKAKRGHALAYEYNFLVRAVDWLFYAPDSIISQSDHADMLAKLDALTTYVADIFEDLPYYPPNTLTVWGFPSGTTIYPQSCVMQMRLRHLAGLGYSALVLMEDSTFMAIGNNSTRIPTMLELVDDEFKVHNYFGETGLLALSHQSSGAYNSGLGYQNTTYQDLTMFFTAYKRLSNGATNYFNNQYVTGAVEHAATMLTPSLYWLPYDDCWRYKRTIILGLAEFFYHNTNNTSTINLVGWYIKNALSSYTGYLPYEFTSINTPSYHLVVPCYNPDSSIKIDDNFSVPSNYSNGFYSDEEFAILRDEITSVSDLEEGPALYVLYENSMGHHDHADQTSYSLFFKEEELLINPGYKWTLREWVWSPYAHNMIVVSPDSLGEYDELYKDFWYDSLGVNTFTGYEPKPLPDHTNHTNPVCQSPAYKNYGFSFQDIDRLKIELNYYDSVDVARNFYRIDSHFLIYDQIETIDSSSRTYWNMLHFPPYLANASYTELNNDVFTFQKNSVKLHGVIGANTSSSYYIYDEFNPNNLPNTGADLSTSPPTSDSWHKRGKLSATGIDPKMLTLLIPSDSSTNPIAPDYIESGNGYYGVKYDLDSTDDYAAFTGIKSESLGYFSFTETPQVAIETDAEFFLIEANSDFNDYRKIILNGGNELELQTNITVFDADVTFEEMMASYDQGNLSIVFKSDSHYYPKYKILRCGVDPENLTSSTEYGLASPGGGQSSTRATIEDNINTLAYDDEYFYVNYTYPNMQSEGLLTSNLVVYSGPFSSTLFSTYGYPDTLTFGGNVDLSGTYTIQDTVDLVFIAGANPTLASTAKFNIYGSISAIGLSGNEIQFNTDSDWDGFYIYADAESEFEYCTFENSDYPVRCLGSINMNHCEITNCTNGLFLQDCDEYIVEENEFYDCDNYGLFISNIDQSAFSVYSLWNNEIHANDYGIHLFNADVFIDSNYVYANYTHGILATSGSTSIIEYSCIQDTEEDDDNPEIYLVGDSYPVIDNRYNDIIKGSDYAIYNADREPAGYKVRNNYWGTTKTSTIKEGFYPSTWDVGWDPYLISDTTGFYNSRSTNLFEMGLDAEEAGQLQIAKEIYLQCIDESDIEVEAVWAASRLMNCVDPEDNFTYSDAQDIYEIISTDNRAILSIFAQKQIINCDRKNKDYQEAILKYEEMLTDSLSTIDSLLVQLNIVHTYFEAESSPGRGNLSFQNSDNSIQNHKHARQKEKTLLNLISYETSGNADQIPIPNKAILYNNYPNPFNPETKISFAIPEESNVRISIYNIKGQRVKTLVNDHLERGIHEIIWRSKDNSGKSVASGVYFYKLEVENKIKGLKKMLLLK
ncbi:MAG: hypothetical protein DRH79_04355 [Candidatus Cloacimonadota bacterium]|nr:MAG: hypothetical protein DRH79_04355 [Candidatus Cloacimonadota bacterium]